MRFELTDVQRMVRDAARAFATSKLAPNAARFEREENVPAEVFRELGELGLMAVNVPEDLGGADAGALAYSLALTEIARGCAATAVAMAVTNMCGELIARFGTPPQRARYSARLGGGMLASFAASEVSAGSDIRNIRTSARREQDRWVLRGTKQWISHGDTAGLLLVFARIEPTDRISCFLVDGGAEGLSVGKHEDKMGLRASHTVSLALDDVVVQDDAVLGAVGEGFVVANAGLDGGRIGIASQSLGIASAALDKAVAYSQQRMQFGKHLSEFQATQWKIADSRKDIEAARLLTWRAAFLKESGLPYRREASMAKVFASEAAIRVCNAALQIFGGYGYTREFDVERHLRDVRVATIYEGTSEIQRLLIARSL